MIANAEQPVTVGFSVRELTQPLIAKVTAKSSVNFIAVELADIVPHLFCNLRRLGDGFQFLGNLPPFSFCDESLLLQMFEYLLRDLQKENSELEHQADCLFGIAQTRTGVSRPTRVATVS